MNAWIVILAAGLGSYLFRLSAIVLIDRITMPAYLQRASRLVAPAACAALAATGVATACTGLGITQAVAPLAGMPTLWITTILLSH
jgi:branched-subunit amino acid transport protein